MLLSFPPDPYKLRMRMVGPGLIPVSQMRDKHRRTNHVGRVCIMTALEGCGGGYYGNTERAPDLPVGQVMKIFKKRWELGAK